MCPSRRSTTRVRTTIDTRDGGRHGGRGKRSFAPGRTRPGRACARGRRSSTRKLRGFRRGARRAMSSDRLVATSGVCSGGSGRTERKDTTPSPKCWGLDSTESPGIEKMNLFNTKVRLPFVHLRLRKCPYACATTRFDAILLTQRPEAERRTRRRGVMGRFKSSPLARAQPRRPGVVPASGRRLPRRRGWVHTVTRAYRTVPYGWP